MPVNQNAEVVGNGRGDLFAQVAGAGEYRCWRLDRIDVDRFRLREFDEIVIDANADAESCKVVQVGHPDE